MASPFRTFRKNQKAWMVALTIFTMFAFVFLGRRATGSSVGKLEDPEVFTWDYGTVHKSDLENRKQFAAIGQAVFNSRPFLRSNPDPMALAAASVANSRQPVSNVRRDKSSKPCFWRKRLQQLGIVVSDDMVNQAFSQLYSMTACARTIGGHRSPNAGPDRTSQPGRFVRCTAKRIGRHVCGRSLFSAVYSRQRQELSSSEAIRRAIAGITSAG